MWERLNTGCKSIIWVGLLLLLLLSPAPLWAEDPLQELNQILADYKQITLGLQQDWKSASVSLTSLESSVPQMKIDLEALQQNSHERDLRLTILESQSEMDRIDQENSQRTIADLKSGFKSMEKAFLGLKIKNTIITAVAVALAVGLAAYVVAYPP